MSGIDDALPEYWPRAGDRLFIQSHHSVDAQIATAQGERLYRMKKAFKVAADLLVSHSEENRYERRNLVWPVVFCYRQYLELALKDMIAGHGLKVVPKIQANWKDHGLLVLWKSYRKLIAATLSGINAEDIPEVAAIEACINEFNQIDAGSYTFRYPTDKEGRLAEIPLNSVNLCHLRNVMEGIYLFLDANESVLEQHFDHPYP